MKNALRFIKQIALMSSIFCLTLAVIGCADKTQTTSTKKVSTSSEPADIQQSTDKPTSSPSVATPLPTPSAPTQTTITISAAGDCTFGSDKSSPSGVNFYSVYNNKKDDSYFFKNVKKYFEKDDVVRIIPCRISSTSAINDYQPTPLKGQEKMRILQNMNRFSKKFGISFHKNGKVDTSLKEEQN